MTSSNLPKVREPLSHFIKVEEFNISRDLNKTLTENNKTLAENSFTEIDHINKTHTPYIDAESLVTSLGTDRKPIRKLLADSAEEDVQKVNGKSSIRISIVKEFLQTYSEQPRPRSTQIKTQTTQQLINEAGRLTYEQIVEQQNSEDNDDKS
ncbi:hypothetical protein PVK63_13895 [Aliivibrio sp. S2TY2]|uniref:hypothetical protein n=1 Tax=unclassified Aliivibrio TaxID=2645654 RepID=UPI002378D8D9|nr:MULTISPECIES: hypothetical protein [unclassified Aliivibrio]MDD9176051.1 hypothetical protein [Aliivibrio sp. S3TY1]MDD9193035.1 hypothetical protein [Aliivibrio sp. S2TY2]